MSYQFRLGSIQDLQSFESFVVALTERVGTIKYVNVSLNEMKALSNAGVPFIDGVGLVTTVAGPIHVMCQAAANPNTGSQAPVAEQRRADRSMDPLLK